MEKSKARELSIALWHAHLDGLRSEWEWLNDKLGGALENQRVAELDLTNAREEIRRVSGGQSAAILWRLDTLEQSVEDAYAEKRLAKKAVRKWKTIVAGLEAKIAETVASIESARTAILRETELYQAGQ
jgi:hypothetical protein